MRIDVKASSDTATLAAEAEERQQWIEVHGSERLKLCVELGVGCEQAYRNERLAATYPGWVWAPTSLDQDPDPHDPPIEALYLLRAARKATASAVRNSLHLGAPIDLIWWVRGHKYWSKCEVKACPDNERTYWDWTFPETGWRLQAMFLGARIMSPVIRCKSGQKATDSVDGKETR